MLRVATSLVSSWAWTRLGSPKNILLCRAGCARSASAARLACKQDLFRFVRWPSWKLLCKTALEMCVTGMLRGACLFCIHARARVGGCSGPSKECQLTMPRVRATWSASQCRINVLLPGILWDFNCALWLLRGVLLLGCGPKPGLKPGKPRATRLPQEMPPSPCFSRLWSTGAWSGRRIPTGRFWISALLKSGDPSMGSGLTGHSCKHTGLSWAGKADFSKDSCSILGHHSLKDRRSVVTYSRDIQAGPL